MTEPNLEPVRLEGPPKSLNVNDKRKQEVVERGRRIRWERAVHAFDLEAQDRDRLLDEDRECFRRHWHFIVEKVARDEVDEAKEDWELTGAEIVAEAIFDGISNLNAVGNQEVDELLNETVELLAAIYSLKEPARKASGT